MTENNQGIINNIETGIKAEQASSTQAQPDLRRNLTTEQVLERLRGVMELGSLKPYVGKPKDRNII